MSPTRIILLSLAAVVVLLIALAIRPIEPVSFDDTVLVEGRVLRITNDGGPGDISIYLMGDDNYYYINRGEERGLKTSELHSMLEGQRVKLFYADHWTPLDPFGTHRHVSRLQSEDRILFDEITIAD